MSMRMGFRMGNGDGKWEVKDGGKRWSEGKLETHEQQSNNKKNLESNSHNS